MTASRLEGQAEVFDQAKLSIASELDGEMRGWSFAEMLVQLKTATEETCREQSRKKRKPVRDFSRHYLGMHGAGYRKVRGWLSETEGMSTGEVQLVLRVLNKLRDRPSDFREPPEPIEPDGVTEPKAAGMTRKLIDHIITVFNSSRMLVVEAGIKPEDLFDGDRIQVRNALEEICSSFGIKVVFLDPEEGGEPLTQRDLAELGLSRMTRRKERS